MNRRDHIVVDSAVCAGKPSLEGTRTTVDLLLDRLADGWSHDDILVAYPQITCEQVLAVERFASEQFDAQRGVAGTRSDR